MLKSLHFKVVFDLLNENDYELVSQGKSNGSMVVTDFLVTIYEPCMTSKGSDQPALMHSLIRAFASRLKTL